MPYYDYLCTSCEHEFEVCMKISERNIPTQEPCPECSEREVKHKIDNTIAWKIDNTIAWNPKMHKKPTN